jgi:hemerythrin
MSFLEWKDELSVGISVIDKQHKELVNTINELHSAMSMGKGKEHLNEVLKKLTDYTKEHFKAEEGYMTKYGYPDYDAHKKEHNLFVEKVENFKRDFGLGKLLVSLEVMSFLRDWLVNHIANTDKKYTGFFNSKGLN